MLPASRRMAGAIVACLASLALGAAAGQAQEMGAQPAPGVAQPIEFRAAERARLLSHGPWPAAWRADPSNRMSGNAAAIELGRRLFGDVRVSGSAQVACATCHQPARVFSDGRARGMGLEEVERNTPSLVDLRLQRWFGWGGASDSLWLASLRPLLDPREMETSAPKLRRLLAEDAELRACYRRAFGTAPEASMQPLVDTGKALAAFIETMGNERNAFDAFRDALQAKDAAGIAAYPAAATRGAQLFVGRGNCFVCHSGPTFSNGEFHDVGVPYFLAPGVVDSGRHAGIEAVRASPFNRLSRFADDGGASAIATRQVRLEHRHWGQFRVPSLRNVALTAPYMHDGSMASLRDVLRHYSELNEERLHADGERLLRPLRLSPRETDDLLAFLESLSAPTIRVAQANPAACR
jgi:cytochrome c peroxidase